MLLITFRIQKGISTILIILVNISDSWLIYFEYGAINMSKTCFVIMPIGDQKCEDKIIISASDLRNKYDGLIKEAINKARPDLLITRADDIPNPGTITNVIIDNLISSDYVVADITYPNPNVFYELGIRHTYRKGTILIKENINTKVPFDVFPLRHIVYDNTVLGLKKLSDDLKKTFDSFDENPDFFDNQVLEITHQKKYEFLKTDNKKRLFRESWVWGEIFEAGRNTNVYINVEDTYLALIQNSSMLNCMVDIGFSLGVASYHSQNKELVEKYDELRTQLMNES